MNTQKIKGVFPVVATPFDQNYNVDTSSFRNLIRYIVKAGAHGLTYPAVASEFYSLSDNERKTLTRILIEEVNGRIPVVITTTASSTSLAIELSKHAVESGADAIMLMPPYVVKDKFSGILNYYKAVADNIGKPIILQNAPSPLGSCLSIEQVCNIIEKVPQVKYVKEENMPCGQRISQILANTEDSFSGVFGGAGGRYLIDELNRGAIGVMPACELTEIHVKIYDHFRNGDRSKARNLYYKSLPLLNFQAIFRMAMTKQVLQRRGIINHTGIRTGAVSLDKYDHEELDTMLNEAEDLLLSFESA